MSRKTSTLVNDLQDWYNGLQRTEKFVIGWLSFVAVAVIVTVILLSVFWSVWVGIITAAIVVFFVTVACFIYLEDEGWF